MTVGRVKVLAAASLLALGVVPLFASSAAADVESEAKIFQLVKLDDIRQDADAKTGHNETWNDVSNSSGTGAATQTNNANVTSGDASAGNTLKEVDIFLWAQQWTTSQTTKGFDDAESEASVKQIVKVDIDQDADARTGGNDSHNGYVESEGTATNTSGLGAATQTNSANITSGDATAWNVLDHLHGNEHAENTVGTQNTEELESKRVPV